MGPLKVGSRGLWSRGLRELQPLSQVVWSGCFVKLSHSVTRYSTQLCMLAHLRVGMQICLKGAQLMERCIENVVNFSRIFKETFMILIIYFISVTITVIIGHY